MGVRQGIILHCCLLLALTNCQTKPASSEQASTTSTVNSQTTSSTEQVSSQTAATNSNTTAAPGTQNGSLQNTNTTTQTTATPGRIDACALITRAEIESAQGEEVKEARSTAVAHSRFNVSQCYYAVASPVKSVSLELTARSPGQSGAASPRQFWEERFERAGREKERERERERQGNNKREADKDGGRREEEEEEGGSPPVRVTGVGDEAFWVGNRKVGALYVLKGDSIIRISIGGPDTESVKLEKMKTLAQLAIKRLKD